jgi:DNA repair exonuclease SbcCD ATPase subunit
MENNLQNPAPGEPFDMLAGESEITLTPENPASETPSDATSHELPQETAKQYAGLSRKELLDIFENLLTSATAEAADTLRREAELIKSAFYKLLWQERKIQETQGTEEQTATEPVADELETAFKNLYNDYKQKRAIHNQQAEKEKEENLAKKLAIIEELKMLLEKQEDLNQTFPAFRALQQHWRETGPVPASRVKDVWDTYQYNVERFYDYVKINNELRDLDLKKNLEAKTVLCEKAEELLQEPSIVNAFNTLQRFHEQWRDIGPVARELREQMWERFKNATTAINKKHQDYFEQQKEEQLKNLAAKKALCEQAEELAGKEIKEISEWNKCSKELEQLHQAWKTIGFATKKDNAKVYARFRAACHKFYTAKREFYGSFKDEMQQNLKLKIALCEQAEAVRESEDWKKTTDKFISLQKQWREIGPIARKQSDAVWKRFRSACDDFFSRKKKHFSTVDAQYSENLRLKETIIKEIEDFTPGADNTGNVDALQAFQHRWTEIGFVPIKDKERLQSAYRAAIDKHFSALHLSDTEKKIIRFKNRMDDIQQSGKSGRIIRAEREKLVQKLRQLEADMALWENNIGFFAKSKNADALIADVNKKIAAAKEEIKTVEAKIKLIDKQYE